MILICIAVTALFARAISSHKPFWIEDESQFESQNPFEHIDITDDDEFITDYSGITTFAHLPFINCLHPTYTDEAKEKFDIAIIGAPFDTSVTYRPGYDRMSDGKLI